MTKIPPGAKVRIGGREFKLSPGRAKYNTALKKKDKPTEDGYFFDSVKELREYQELKLRKAGGDIQDFWVKPKIWGIFKMGDHCSLNADYLILAGKKPKSTHNIIRYFTYIPDFIVFKDYVLREVIDVKGYVNKKDPYWRLFQMKVKFLELLALKVTVK